MFKPEFNRESLPTYTRMYLIIKDMVEPWEAMTEQGCIEGGVKYDPANDAELVEAKALIAEFEADLGPIPDWAICKNFGNQYITGAQLFTTNGRRSGNGWLVEIRQVDDTLYPGKTLTQYVVLTDAGSRMTLTKRELEIAFDAGDWICSPERIIKDFDRHNHFSCPEKREDG